MRSINHQKACPDQITWWGWQGSQISKRANPKVHAFFKPLLASCLLILFHQPEKSHSQPRVKSQDPGKQTLLPEEASACNTGNLGSIPGWGRFPGEENSNLLQYPCLENPMDGEGWQATVHGVSKSRTRLSDFTFTFFTFLKRRGAESHGKGCAYKDGRNL